jgi:hypothetical protein
LLVALMLSATLMVAGCGGQSRAQLATAQIGTGQIQTGGPRVAGLGDAFSGVVWTGEVRSVGADWRVPAIRAGSQAGRAATWIGAQALSAKPGSSFLDTPFIQIGTREELRPAATDNGRGELFYEAFWTDTDRDLHPLSLLAVHPGDAVSAQMSLAGRRWTLTFADRTTGQNTRVSTGDDGTGDFALALWLQEDPTDTATNGVFAYPDLAPVHVTSLRVNASRPAPATLKTTWMRLPHAYLAPTAPSAEGFTVVPETMTAAGARYLNIVDPVETRVNRFLAQALAWKPTESPAVIRSATAGLIATLESNVAALRAASWPAAVAGLIRRLVSVDAAQIPSLQRVAGQGRDAVLEALGHGTGQAAQATLGVEIRRRLGLALFAY